MAQELKVIADFYDFMLWLRNQRGHSTFQIDPAMKSKGTFYFSDRPGYFSDRPDCLFQTDDVDWMVSDLEK